MSRRAPWKQLANRLREKTGKQPEIIPVGMKTLKNEKEKVKIILDNSG